MYDSNEKHIGLNTSVTTLQPEYEHGYQASHVPGYSVSTTSKSSGLLTRWSSTAFLVSYFIFSIALYTILNDTATKIFWFLYLTIATLVAGVTFLEAYDGITPLTEARKAILKADMDDQKWTTPESELPFVDLVFDRTDEAVPAAAIAKVEQCVRELAYPTNKMRAYVLICINEDNDSRLESPDRGQISPVSVVLVPYHAASSHPSRLAQYFASRYSNAATTAYFTGKQLPHPHSVRVASERLVQDAKVDIVQGRAVSVPMASHASIFATTACLENDLREALLRPGQGETWGLRVANGANAYWRTNVLRDAVSASARVLNDGCDLGFTSVRHGARVIYDLRVMAHEPCINSVSQYWHWHTDHGRQLLLAVGRYTGIAFRRTPKAADDANVLKWTMKKRFSVFYMLPITLLASHAICQYSSMALALLFTKTPHSASDFAQTIYFSYPVSEWLILVGLVCLIAMTAMAYKARSEFVPTWVLPVFLVTYPIQVLLWAIASVQGQADALLT